MLIPPESIVAIANSIGIEKLDKKVASSLADDVEYRLREVVQDALKFMGHAHQQQLKTTDIDTALRLKNIEALYGYSSSEQMSFQKVQANENIFYVKSREVTFEEVVGADLPPPPKEITFNVHWLAVDGVQPRIPENPPKSSKAIGPAQGVKLDASEKRDIKKYVKHLLTQEEQLYYQKVTKCILSDKEVDEKTRITVLRSLRSDAGLHQLLPYFTQFIADETHRNMKNLPVLKSLMAMAQALIQSPHMNINHYIHQLMPAICSCLLARRLCKKGMQDHWSLRDHAAQLIRLVCNKFKVQYPDLQTRITQTLTSALLNHKKPMTTHYGAICGIGSLGPLSVKKFLLPYMQVYMGNLKPQLENQNKDKRREAHRVFGALLRACGSYVRFEFSNLKPLSCVPKSDAKEDQKGASSGASSGNAKNGQKRKRKGDPKSKKHAKKSKTARRSDQYSSSSKPDEIPSGEDSKVDENGKTEKMEIDSPPPPPPRDPTMGRMTIEMQDSQFSVPGLQEIFGESLHTYSQIKGSYLSEVFI